LEVSGAVRQLVDVRRLKVNKPSLHNNIITVADYCYNHLAKQNISPLLGCHQAYKTVVLVKVKTSECTLINTTVLEA